MPNNQDNKLISFEDYKASFKGMCTDDMALEMWIIFETTQQKDSEKLRREIKDAKEMVENANTSVHNGV